LRYLSKMRVESVPSSASSEHERVRETTPIDQDPDKDDYNARIERELREM
jgi:hypothetical protein